MDVARFNVVWYKGDFSIILSSSQYVSSYKKSRTEKNSIASIFDQTERIENELFHFPLLSLVWWYFRIKNDVLSLLAPPSVILFPSYKILYVLKRRNPVDLLFLRPRVLFHLTKKKTKRTKHLWAGKSGMARQHSDRRNLIFCPVGSLAVSWVLLWRTRAIYDISSWGAFVSRQMENNRRWEE